MTRIDIEGAVLKGSNRTHALHRRHWLDRRFGVAVALVLSLAGSAGLRAAEKAERSVGAAKPGGALLTPVQLRDCLAQQQRLQSRSAEALTQKSALDTDKAEIDRLGAALKEQVATLDRTSADAVAAYNVQAETHDKLIDAYQAGVGAYNAKANVLKAEQGTFATACGNRRYDENDEIAIRKGKR